MGTSEHEGEGLRQFPIALGFSHRAKLEALRRSGGFRSAAETVRSLIDEASVGLPDLGRTGPGMKPYRVPAGGGTFVDADLGHHGPKARDRQGK